MLALYVSRTLLASRSLRPFHLTASRCHLLVAWMANDRSWYGSLLEGRTCKSRTIRTITNAHAGCPTRAQSYIFRRRYREPSREVSLRSRRWAACHGELRAAWAVLMPVRPMDGLRSSDCRRKASSL